VNLPENLEIQQLEQSPAPLEPTIIYGEHYFSSSDRLALIEGRSFFVANLAGDLMPPSAPHIGLFYHDTRFLSQLQLTVNGDPPTILSSSTERSFATKVELTARGKSSGTDLDFPMHTVHIHREQLLSGGILYDTYSYQNFHGAPTLMNMEIVYDADFMDIFQVRGLLRGRSGRYYRPIHSSERLLFVYEGLDTRLRSTEIRFFTKPRSIRERTASWEIKLEPGEQYRVMTAILPHYQEEQNGIHIDLATPRSKGVSQSFVVCVENIESCTANKREEYNDWFHECTRFQSDNEIFDRMIHTSVNDFYALQIPDHGKRIVAAGIPWFATIFGRDSIISSLQALIINPKLARDTLQVLARYQGVQTDAPRDEEPGKIVHEVRSGEMTATGEVAFGLNYGSVDATPLFLVLLGHLYDWTGDMDFVRKLLPAADKALDWITSRGDLDGDCFIEFERKSPKGLFNQGWKDSGDANVYSNGSIAHPPLALIEVQGYVVDAFTRFARIASLLGRKEAAEELRRRAQEVMSALNRKFWSTDMGYYVMGLDKDKRPLNVFSSNPGHLLFSRAVSEERSHDLVNRLMEDGLFSGWGIRTLSSHERGFNPLSYHRGSVWPHDNSLIAYGMSLYGFQKEAARLLESLYHAALYFRDYRLPELFCGVQRVGHDEPVHYPVSSSPQAWASGTFLLMLTGLLGLRPEAANHQLSIVNPHLPGFINRLELRNLHVGESRISLEYLRRDSRTFCNIIDIAGKPIEVKIAFQHR
jgi:glycogen debranching enzyme